jgi:flagellar basal-body rod protein FlgF
MDRMIFMAMAAARQTQRAQALATNNLVNASTDGFRGDLQYAMSLNVSGPGHASRAFSALRPGGVDLTPGAVMTTGNPLDVAIEGAGLFAVEAPDGAEAYTRGGALVVDPTGLLRTQAGHPVLGDGGPIVLPPYEQLLIGDDGTVSVRPKGAGGAQLAQVGRLKMVNPEADAVEASNVNAVGAMVRQMDLARQFEAQMKLMAAAQTLDEGSDRLLRQG